MTTVNVMVEPMPSNSTAIESNADMQRYHHPDNRNGHRHDKMVFR